MITIPWVRHELSNIDATCLPTTAQVLQSITKLYPQTRTHCNPSQFHILIIQHTNTSPIINLKLMRMRMTTIKRIPNLILMKWKGRDEYLPELLRRRSVLRKPERISSRAAQSPLQTSPEPQAPLRRRSLFFFFLIYSREIRQKKKSEIIYHASIWNWDLAWISRIKEQSSSKNQCSLFLVLHPFQAWRVRSIQRLEFPLSLSLLLSLCVSDLFLFAFCFFFLLLKIEGKRMTQRDVAF